MVIGTGSAVGIGRITHKNIIYNELTHLNLFIIIYPILYAQLQVNP
jgi:hypothetical protein